VLNSVKAILITLIIPVIFAGTASATVLTTDTIKRNIEKQIEEQLKSSIKGDINVAVNQLPCTNIQVPEGKVTYKTSVNLKYFTPKTLAKVDIIVNDRVIKTFGVPIDITVSDYVWVAAENINRGKAFNSSNIRLEKVELGRYANSAAREDFDYQNSFAGRTFRPGEIIDTNFVQTNPDVRKDSMVSVIFQSPSVQLVLDGIAMENGKIGDFVKVKNKKYNRFYTGEVIDKNQILVKI